MSKLHSYPWYPADWRDSETRAAMSMEEHGIYRELLDYCWVEGTLPTSHKLLIKLTGCTAEEWERSSASALTKFEEIDGRLHHRRVDDRRPELVRWHEQKAEGGRRSGEVRRERALEHSSNTLRTDFKDSSNGLRTLFEPSASSSTSLSVVSGAQNIPSPDQRPEPEDPAPLPSGRRKPTQSKKYPWQGLDRPTLAEIPKPPKPPSKAETDEVARILSDFGEVSRGLSPPDSALVARICTVLGRSGQPPDALVEILKPRRDAIRNANSWGLVITIIEAACRGRPGNQNANPTRQGHTATASSPFLR